MDYIYYLYYASDLLDLAKHYIEQYHYYIWIGLLVIALLNCFFGFHLRKLWGILAGFAIGAAVAAGTCIYIGKQGTILYLVTILGAFTFGLLALLLYKVGLFFIGSLSVPLVLSRLFPTDQREILLFWIILGLVVGILTLAWERETISTITAVGGGFGAAQCMLTLRNHHSIVMLCMIGLALSLAGILLQFQPWRSRTDWNSDEERARDKQRHNRRMKRIRRKKKRQEKIEQKKAAKKQAASSSRGGRSFHTGSNPLQRKPAQHHGESTEYTPYTTHPLYQATLSRKRMEDEKIMAPDSVPVPEKDRMPYTGLDPMDQTDYGTNPNHASHSVSPDLSDIRQIISQEVSDIYEERQQYMDASLNELLEREYKHTTNALNGNTGRSD